jgi:anti-sigma B factor antagonist
VAGEIDTDTAAQLSDVIGSALSSQPAHVVVDLSAVTFLASSGMRALQTAQRVADEYGAALTVRNARGIVLRVLTISGPLAAVPRGCRALATRLTMMRSSRPGSACR